MGARVGPLSPACAKTRTGEDIFLTANEVQILRHNIPCREAIAHLPLDVSKGLECQSKEAVIAIRVKPLERFDSHEVQSQPLDESRG